MSKHATFVGRWCWYARVPGDETFICEQPTRAETIAEALREWGPGTEVELVEAVMSQDRRHEGADVIPFIRERNREVITLEGGAE